MAKDNNCDYEKIRQQNKTLTDSAFTEDEFQTIFSLCRPFTMTSQERMYALYTATQYIVKAGIAGDFVECGVWQGGSCMNMALTLLSQGDTSRKIYLFDTYQGMTPPDSVDVDLQDRTATDLINSPTECELMMCVAPLAVVQRNLYTTGYPQNKFCFVEGDVAETIPEFAPKQIALLRLDTDWYASTKHEIEHLYPLLSPGGVLIIDDYGHWRGSKKAVDEYFENTTPIFMNRIDYSGRLIIKR